MSNAKKKRKKRSYRSWVTRLKNQYVQTTAPQREVYDMHHGT